MAIAKYIIHVPIYSVFDKRIKMKQVLVNWIN